MGAVSCQKEDAPVRNEEPAASEITITASIAGGTKTAYNDDGSKLVQTWAVDDEVFGFLDGEPSTTVTFKVTAVDPSTGIATLEQITSVNLSGKTIHLIYYPGKEADCLSSGTLAVDLSYQSFDTVPAIMLASATESGGSINFVFSNACAIIGVKNPSFSGVTATSVQNLTLSSHSIVAEGTIAVSGGNLVLTPSAPSKFITKQIYNGIVADETYYIAAIACSPADLVLSAVGFVGYATLDPTPEYPCEYAIMTLDTLALGDKTIEANNYYCVYDKTFTSVTLPTAGAQVTTTDGAVWADRNLGATSATPGDVNALGDYYQWGAVEKIYTDITDRSLTSGTFSFVSGKSFVIANAPYYSGSTYTKYIYGSDKTSLDPVDDIVQINYPGSGWRMPTVEEFQAMNTAATSKDWDSTNKGKTFVINEKSLWFPAAGFGDNSALRYPGERACYLSSSLSGSTSNASAMYFNVSQFFLPSGSYRYDGFSVRPVIDCETN